MKTMIGKILVIAAVLLAVALMLSQLGVRRAVSGEASTAAEPSAAAVSAAKEEAGQPAAAPEGSMPAAEAAMTPLPVTEEVNLLDLIDKGGLGGEEAVEAAPAPAPSDAQGGAETPEYGEIGG